MGVRQESAGHFGRIADQVEAVDGAVAYLHGHQGIHPVRGDQQQAEATIEAVFLDAQRAMSPVCTVVNWCPEKDSNL